MCYQFAIQTLFIDDESMWHVKYYCDVMGQYSCTDDHINPVVMTL